MDIQIQKLMMKIMGKKVGLLGQRFGKLLVISNAGRNKWGNIFWNCICDCGSKIVVPGASLSKGSKKGCGCERKTGTPEYVTWRSMRQRCLNSNDPSYKSYGGRGITICERWKSFESFFTDMGKKPRKELTIERINNDLGYMPSNCKWATRTEQVRNRRIQKNNTTGVNGVQWTKKRKRYRAKIKVNSKSIELGLFSNFSDAVEARQQGEAKYWER